MCGGSQHVSRRRWQRLEWNFRANWKVKRLSGNITTWTRIVSPNTRRDWHVVCSKDQIRGDQIFVFILDLKTLIKWKSTFRRYVASTKSRALAWLAFAFARLRVCDWQMQPEIHYWFALHKSYLAYVWHRDDGAEETIEKLPAEVTRSAGRLRVQFHPEPLSWLEPGFCFLKPKLKA